MGIAPPKNVIDAVPRIPVPLDIPSPHRRMMKIRFNLTDARFAAAKGGGPWRAEMSTLERNHGDSRVFDPAKGNPAKRGGSSQQQSDSWRVSTGTLARLPRVPREGFCGETRTLDPFDNGCQPRILDPAGFIINLLLRRRHRPPCFPPPSAYSPRPASLALSALPPRITSIIL